MGKNDLSAYFLIGPTASGKTAVAQRIAEEDGFDIVSADSMLIYCGMDVGTAKPSREEQARARYWCMDLADPGSHFSVALFREAALKALSRIATEGKQAIVVGGTGLYVKALTHGLSPTPPGARECEIGREGQDLPSNLPLLPDKPAGGDPSSRCYDVAGKAAHLSGLQAILQKEAPEMYAALADKQNPRRLVRAIEMERAGIKQPLNLWKRHGAGPVLTGLRLPLAQLRVRIEARVRKMYGNGLLEEVRVLCGSGFDKASTARGAIGYAEAIAHLEGRCTIEEAILQTTRRTVQLARRQMTWFRNQANVDWIDVNTTDDTGDVARAVRQSWKKNGSGEIEPRTET